MRKPAITWTDDMFKRGKRLFEDGCLTSEVAAALGVSTGALASRLARDRSIGIYWRPHTPLTAKRLTLDAVQPVKVYRSLTARLMGDPPVGRSAADVKRAAEVWQQKQASGVGWF